MEEGNFDEKKQREEVDLERRLTAYYGPTLPEQLLPPVSWEQLQHQLNAQPTLQRRFHLRKTRSGPPVPMYILDTFARIAYQASIVYVPAQLRCKFRSEGHMPIVRISPIDRRRVKLLLPLTMQRTMSQVELDVLLATGLARQICARRPGYVLIHFLLLSIILFLCLAVVAFFISALSNMAILIAISIDILLGVIGLWLLNRQRRKLAFRADELMVTWLGRSHVCQGLHALADASPVSYNRRWGEPSLLERIVHVCGTRVGTRDPRLVILR